MLTDKISRSESRLLRDKVSRSNPRLMAVAQLAVDEFDDQSEPAKVGPLPPGHVSPEADIRLDPVAVAEPTAARPADEDSVGDESLKMGLDRALGEPGVLAHAAPVPKSELLLMGGRCDLSDVAEKGRAAPPSPEVDSLEHGKDGGGVQRLVH